MRSNEQALLIDYMDNGGSLYVEGANCLSKYQETEYAEYLGAGFSQWENFVDITPVSGQAGQITDGMQFNYNDVEAFRYRIDQLAPGNGQVIFSGQDTTPYTVAYRGNGYNTVVSSLMFGGLVDGIGENTKQNLMSMYIEFLMDTHTGMYNPQTTRKEITNRLANYPNPFNPETIINFTIDKDDRYDIRIFDIKGRIVRQIFTGLPYSPGTYSTIWDGKNDNGIEAASGLYFVQLRGSRDYWSKKILLAK